MKKDTVHSPSLIGAEKALVVPFTSGLMTFLLIG